MMFGGKVEVDESCRIIDAAIEGGINFLDTANVYGNPNGRSEEFTGEALKRNGKRDLIFLATKFHGRMRKDDDLDPNRWGNSRRQIMECIEDSLRRLQTDYIDLYQAHRPHPDCPIDETLRALDDVVRQGKVRYIGTSTFAAWQVVESLWAADRYRLNRFVSEQPAYNMLDRRAERELVPMAQTYGIALIPWSPLAGGFLTAKYQRGESSEGSRLDPQSDEGRTGRMMNSDAAWAVADVLKEIAKEKSCTPAQFALAWSMHQPGITAPIIGPRTMEQLQDNLGAADVEVTDADRERIDAVSKPGEMIVPFYEAKFGPHPNRW